MRPRPLLVLLIVTLASCRGAKTAAELQDVNALEAALHQGDDAARAKAALDLSKHGPNAAKAVPALAAALASPEPLLRQNAALALGKIGPAAKAAVPTLTRALADNEWAVRRQAVIALGEIGDQQALAAVEGLTRDPVSLVRKAAVESAGKLRR